METEKRIGDFRVNRKVSWGITFPQNLHTAYLIQNAPLARLCAGFVHSPGVEVRTLFPQPPDTLGQAGDRGRILVAQPPVSSRPGPRLGRPCMDGTVRVDDDLFRVL